VRVETELALQQNLVQYIVIVVDGGSFGGRDLESDAGGPSSGW